MNQQLAVLSAIFITFTITSILGILYGLKTFFELPTIKELIKKDLQTSPK